MKLQEIKRPIRAFLKKFPDERLAALLAHAQDGKLSFYSCCCLSGALTANHPLRGYVEKGINYGAHYNLSTWLSGARAAEDAFRLLRQETLGVPLKPGTGDALRRRRIIPMIKAEMRIRERKRAEVCCEATRDLDASCVLAAC